MAKKLPLNAFRAHAMAWIVMILGMALFVYWRLFPQSLGRTSVPLHYNIHLGADSFGPWWMLFLGSGFGLITAAVNSILFVLASRRYVRRASLFLWAATVTLAFLSIGTFFVVLLNISYD